MNTNSILLVSAYFPPSVGGPATFVSEIGKAFQDKGYAVTYANLEPYKKNSRFKRMFLFLRDVWKSVATSDVVLIADTWSVLLPTAFICKLKGKKYSVRIGGDYLWEMYVARTKKPIKLSAFYSPLPRLSYKEKIAFLLIRKVLTSAHVVFFNTEWQRNIWQKPYALEKIKVRVIRNALVTGKRPYEWNPSFQKIVRCPVRASEFKNVDALQKVWSTLSSQYPGVVLSFDYIHPTQRAEILSQSYAVIQPSISDVAPNLICESVASGCPFICTLDTGITESFSQGIGLYFDTADKDELQKGLKMILDENIHNDQVKKIALCKVSRTYAVLAEEYSILWNKI